MHLVRFLLVKEAVWVEPPKAVVIMETIVHCAVYISEPLFRSDATVLQCLFQDNWLFLYLHPCYQGTYNLACNGEIQEEAWAMPTSICKSLWSQNVYLVSPLNMSNGLNCILLARTELMYVNREAVLLSTFSEPWNLYIDTKRIPI